MFGLYPYNRRDQNPSPREKDWGTGYPLSLYYAPLAVGASIVTVPLAFLLSEKVIAAETKPEAFLQTRAFRRLASPATLAICLLLIVLLRLAK